MWPYAVVKYEFLPDQLLLKLSMAKIIQWLLKMENINPFNCNLDNWEFESYGGYYKFNAFVGVASELVVLGLFRLDGFALKRKDCRTAFRRSVHCSAQPPPPPPAWPGRAVSEPSHFTRDGPKPISIVGSTGSIGTQVQ